MNTAFVLEFVILLTAMVVVVPLTIRIGCSSIQGFLAAGLVIGPSGLGLIVDPQRIAWFGEFGLVMLFFILGLELEPGKLVRMRRQIFGLGALQFVATGGLIAGAVWLLTGDWRTTLLIAAALSFSSTAMGLQALREKGRFGTEGGQAVVSVLLFQNIVFLGIIPLLTLIAPRADKHSLADAVWAGWGLTAMGVVIAAAGAMAGFFLIRLILRLGSRFGHSDLITMCALLVTLGAAAIAQMVGVPPALGALIAGLIFSKTEFRHELEAQIDPFRGLLIGLFYVAFGAQIDIMRIVDEIELTAALVAGLVVGRAAILFGVAGLQGLSRRDRRLFVYTLLPASEIAFVIVVTVGDLSDPLVTVVATIIAASMLLQPFSRSDRSDVQRKARVFVCYARVDSNPAAKLVSFLEAEQFDVTIDTRDLPFGEEWQAEIAGFIRQSDIAIWLVSPASIRSDWCGWELRQVSRFSKRLVPVMIEEVLMADLPEGIEKIQIFPRKGVLDLADKDQWRLLSDALQSDSGWLKEHTRLSERARLWERASRTADWLLRGAELAAAQRWLEEAPEKAPKPGAAVQDLIRASEAVAEPGKGLAASGEPPT